MELKTFSRNIENYKFFLENEIDHSILQSYYAHVSLLSSEKLNLIPKSPLLLKNVIKSLTIEKKRHRVIRAKIF